MIEKIKPLVKKEELLNNRMFPLTRISKYIIKDIYDNEVGTFDTRAMANQWLIAKYPNIKEGNRKNSLVTRVLPRLMVIQKYR